MRPELHDSSLAQTSRDFETLIRDNASSDSTPQICCEYERHDMQMIPRSVDAAAVVQIVSSNAFFSAVVVVQAIIRKNNN
jgi:hypothetical protein